MVDFKFEKEMALELRLNSPVGADPVVFTWPLREEKDGYDGALEIVQMIRLVSQDYSEVEAEMENIFMDFYPNCYARMKSMCHNYNVAVDALLGKGRLKLKQRPTQTQLRQILQQVYNRAVTDPKKLNQYKAFSPEVYGETSFELIAELIAKMEITERDIFIDLGSGIGQIVLQMAASTKCAVCYGVEKAEAPSNYAKEMDKHFRQLMAWYGKSYGEYLITKGDILSDEHREKITSASIIFVNNFAFGPELDNKLKEMFKELKDGVKIISSKPFSPLNFQITERKLSDVGAILNVLEIGCLNGSVSWTSKPVTYYIHEIDRTKLEKYFLRKSGGVKENTVTARKQRKKIGENFKSSCDEISFLSAGPSPAPPTWVRKRGYDKMGGGELTIEKLFGEESEKREKH